jgi:enamine deaminase RidA (YjgF/YER057c/UK114 family)
VSGPLRGRARESGPARRLPAREQGREAGDGGRVKGDDVRIDGSPGSVPALSSGARAELRALGLLDGEQAGSRTDGLDPVPGRSGIGKRAVSAPEVLNEAFDYELPSSFTRGMRVELPGASILYLSGTASVDERGCTVHDGDFAAQCLRTFRNLTRLLAAEDASWHDVIRTTCYLRDIERDYDEFNRVRTMFMQAIALDPLPASTAIQARICRTDLLVEIEAIAIIPGGHASGNGRDAVAKDD